MHVNPTFDTRMMAWSKASDAKDAATTAHEVHLAESVMYLAQALEQLNTKLDSVVRAQAQLLQRRG